MLKCIKAETSSTKLCLEASPDAGDLAGRACAGVVPTDSLHEVCTCCASLSRFAGPGLCHRRSSPETQSDGIPKA